jgi:hypothetical protein
MEMVEVPFLPEWVKDKERRDYERCDFIPNMSKCPETVFNLFNGFAIEEVYQKEIEQCGEIDEKEMMELIQPIQYHTNLLCGGDGSYFEKFMANMIQNPDIKTDVSVLFRDKGGLLFEGGGTGKNHYMDWFGRKIIGSQYYVCVDDNNDLYRSFNSAFEGKLFVFVEEAGGKANHNNADTLKSKISKKRGIVKKKNVAEYEVDDFARFVFGTNNANPLPTKQGDRRSVAYDVNPIHRGDKVYFNTLTKAMDCVRVQCAYYQYLKTMDVWRTPIEFQINRPITECYIDIRQMNAPSHMKWLRYELRRGTLPEEAGARELYERFRGWYATTHNCERGEVPIKETAFCIQIKEAFVDDNTELSISQHKKTMDGMIHKFDFAKLIDGMERLHLLQKGECRVERGCLIQMEI